MGRLLLIGVIVATGLFSAVWAIGVRVKNYGFLDVIWSLSVTFLAPLYAWLGSGTPVHRVLFTLVGVFWSLRLGLYILIRVARHHPDEDKRYRTLRERWHTPVRFWLFFELQALIAVVFSVPFAFAAIENRPVLGTFECVGLGIALLATLGEAAADWQAQRFKQNPAHKQAVVDVGLWCYSRHPNYFFEALVWIGFAIACLDFEWGWIASICPMLMLYFLLAVTGIPLTEKHSLESRGDVYRDYQQRTSRFFPWFPRRGPPRALHK